MEANHSLLMSMIGRQQLGNLTQTYRTHQFVAISACIIINRTLTCKYKSTNFSSTVRLSTFHTCKHFTSGWNILIWWTQCTFKKPVRKECVQLSIRHKYTSSTLVWDWLRSSTCQLKKDSLQFHLLLMVSKKCSLKLGSFNFLLISWELQNKGKSKCG